MTDGRAADSIQEKQKKYLCIFLAVFAIGLLAHVLGLTHDVINHDSISMLDAKGFYWLKDQGKWAAGDINARLSGRFVTASWFLPVGLAFFAAAACLIAEILGIKRTVSGIAVGAVLVTFTTVVSMTVYYGTSYFGFCFFLSVFGAYCISRRCVWCVLAGVGAIALSMGGYQPFIGAAAAVLVLESICRALFSQEETASIVKNGIKYVISLMAGVLLYYAILQLLRKTGYIALDGYQNIDELGSGKIPVAGFIGMLGAALGDAYSVFVKKPILPYLSIRLFYPACGLAACALFVISAIRGALYRKPVRLALTALLMFAVYPIAANLVVVLSMNIYAHDIMKYTIVLLFVVPIVFADRLLSNENRAIENVRGIVGRVLHGRTLYMGAAILSAALALSWACTNNDYYRMMIQAEEQMRADCTAIMSAVYAHDEYTPQTKVALVGNPPYRVFENQQAFISSNVIVPLHNRVTGMQPSSAYLYESGKLKTYMNSRLGADMEFADEEAFYLEHSEACDGMPVFPGGKAVAYIDGVIVVKLGETGAE